MVDAGLERWISRATFHSFFVKRDPPTCEELFGMLSLIRQGQVLSFGRAISQGIEPAFSWPLLIYW